MHIEKRSVTVRWLNILTLKEKEYSVIIILMCHYDSLLLLTVLNTN